MQYRRFLSFIVAAVSSVAAHSAAAQEFTYETLKAELTKVTRAICEQESAKFLESKGIKLLTESQRISRSVICTCAQERFDLDPKIEQLLRRPVHEVTALASTDRFNAYLTMRYMTGMLECTAEEFSEALQGVSFEK